MYKDLAERTIDRKINEENFLLFFHKNGFWGERLFKQFDYDETNLISEQEFIRGIGILFDIQLKFLNPQKNKKLACFSNSFPSQGVRTKEFSTTNFLQW